MLRLRKKRSITEKQRGAVGSQCINDVAFLILFKCEPLHITNSHEIFMRSSRISIAVIWADESSNKAHPVQRRKTPEVFSRCVHRHANCRSECHSPRVLPWHVLCPKQGSPHHLAKRRRH